jgi:(2Fe-2S) ferredoxin
MPQPPPPHKSILLGLLILVLVTGQCSSLSAAPHIQVCQNKDCCKRYQGRIDLFQTIHDLQLDAKVESSGCLSHCGQGPNIEIDGLVLHEITNAATAAVQLELTLGKPIPKLLLAAVQVLEKANGR